MRRILSGLAAITLFASAMPSASAAQPASSPGADDEIVIEGVKQRQREIERFVDALTDPPMRGQIARFGWEVCPVVGGLSQSQNLAIAARLRQVAEAAGIPLAPPGCRGNAVVIVAADKRATMRWLRRTYPAYFRNELGERIPIPDEAGAVSAWQAEGRVNEDGQTMGINNGASGEDAGTGNYYVVESTRGASRIAAASRPHFMASMAVIEHGALRGLTTTQVADYAAMRLFAKTQPSRLERSNAQTILNVIDAPMGAEVPITLTQWDMGFLRALYASEENRYAVQQRHEIGRLLRRDLDAEGESNAN